MPCVAASPGFSPGLFVPGNDFPAPNRIQSDWPTLRQNPAPSTADESPKVHLAGFLDAIFTLVRKQNSIRAILTSEGWSLVYASPCYQKDPESTNNFSLEISLLPRPLVRNSCADADASINGT